MVPKPRRSQGGHRTMAASLQRGAAPFESRVSDADGIQGERRGQPHRGIERTTHAHGASDGRRSPVITGPKNPGRSKASWSITAVTINALPGVGEVEALTRSRVSGSGLSHAFSGLTNYLGD